MYTGLTNLTHIYVSNTQTQQIRTRGGFLLHDKQYNGKKKNNLKKEGLDRCWQALVAYPPISTFLSFKLKK